MNGQRRIILRHRQVLQRSGSLTMSPVQELKRTKDSRTSLARSVCRAPTFQCASADEIPSPTLSLCAWRYAASFGCHQESPWTSYSQISLPRPALKGTDLRSFLAGRKSSLVTRVHTPTVATHLGRRSPTHRLEFDPQANHCYSQTPRLLPGEWSQLQRKTIDDLDSGATLEHAIT